jgi:hypothetical protein
MSTIRFIELIASFVEGKLDAGSFEKKFLELRRSSGDMPEKVEEVVDNLFYDVDAFVEDPALRDEDDIDEEQLRESAQVALKALRLLKGKL